MDIYDDVHVLAAEVGRLRVELQQTLEAHERQAASIRGLQATIARVESQRDYYAEILEEECANYTGRVLEYSEAYDRLAEALRGDP